MNRMIRTDRPRRNGCRLAADPPPPRWLPGWAVFQIEEGGGIRPETSGRLDTIRAAVLADVRGVWWDAHTLAFRCTPPGRRRLLQWVRDNGYVVRRAR